MNSNWDTVLPHNSCCDICCQFISFCRDEDVYCDLCNVVVHLSCLSVLHTIGDGRGHWICNYCTEDKNYSVSNFLERKAKIRFKRIQEHAQEVLSAAWRRYWCRKRYLNMRSKILFVQKHVRAHIRRKMLGLYRSTLLRPLKLRLCSFFGLIDQDAVSDVHIAVVDPLVPSKVLWSLPLRSVGSLIRNSNSSRPQCSLEALIPGVSGGHQIVISLMQFRRGKYVVLGVVTVLLARNEIWKRGGTLRLTVSARHNWKYVYDSIHCAVVCDASNSLSDVTIEVEVLTQNSLSCATGYIYGPCIDTLNKAFKSYSKSTLQQIMTPPQRENSNSHSVSVSMEKLWIVIANNRLYLHRKFGDNCRLIVDLRSTRFSIDARKGNLVFSILLFGLPVLEFVSLSPREVLQWKIAFSTSWQAARLGPNCDFKSLMRETLMVLRAAKQLRQRKGTICMQNTAMSFVPESVLPDQRKVKRQALLLNPVKDIEMHEGKKLNRSLICCGLYQVT